MTLRARLRRSRPLSCEEVGELLQSYLDDELDEDRARRVAAHLDACRRCGLEGEAYEALMTVLARRDDVDPERLARLRAFADALAGGDR